MKTTLKIWGFHIILFILTALIFGAWATLFWIPYIFYLLIESDETNYEKY